MPLRANENFTSKESFKTESPYSDTILKHFWKYFNDKSIFTTLQPALTLLYELPNKPDNLYEFFSEFLENGAQDLVKISFLKAELCYKENELQSLKSKNLDDNHELEESRVTKESIRARTNMEKIKSLLPVVTVSRKNVLDSFLGKTIENIGETKESGTQELILPTRHYGTSNLFHVRPSESVKEAEANESQALHEIVDIISDHRKMDPFGILFDFSVKNAERIYETELYASEAAHDKLSRQKNSFSPFPKKERHESHHSHHSHKSGSRPPENKSQQVGKASMMGRDRASTFLQQKNKVVDKNLHRRLIRDGLRLLHDEKFSAKFSQKEKHLDSIYDSSEDELVLSDEEALKEGKKILKTIRQEMDIKLMEKEESEKFTNSKYNKNDLQSDEFRGDLKRGEICHRLNFLHRAYFDFINRSEITPIFSSLDEELEFGRNIDVAFKKEFENLIRELLQALFNQLLRALNKSYMFRAKYNLAHKRRHKNFGYKKEKVLKHIKNKESAFRSYAITSPTITLKEFEKIAKPSKGFAYKTNTSFLYDFPLDDVTRTQKWIDESFDESVFCLNEIYDSHENRSHGDDAAFTKNYFWTDEREVTNANLSAEGQLLKELEKFSNNTDIFDLSSSEMLQSLTSNNDKVIKNDEVHNCNEGNEFILEVPANSVNIVKVKRRSSSRRSLLNLSKTSERAKHYVQSTFTTKYKQELLEKFPFEMLDE